MMLLKFLLILCAIFAKKVKVKDDELCHEFCRCNTEKRTIICYGQGITELNLEENDSSLETATRIDLRISV